MIASTINDRVAANLGDPTKVHHTADSIMASMQDGYEFVIAKTLCLEKSFTYPQLPNTVYYDFLTSHPDFLAVSAIWSYNINRWLIPASRKLFDQWRWDWELMNGEPRWFDPINFRYTAIVPHNSTVSGGFQVFYKAKASTLTNDSVLALPKSALEIIENYATADQFFIDREFKKGIRYFKQMLEDIPVIKRLSLRKAEADRISIAAPNDSMPIFSDQGENVWVVNETPAGVIDGVNATFTLAGTPNPTGSLMLYWNGQLLYEGTHYELNGNVITMNTGSIPQINVPVDELRAWYQQ